MFLDEQHKANFYLLLNRLEPREADIYHQTLFFILAGNPSLMEIADNIYDFEKKELIPEVLEHNGLSSGENALLQLAVHLYNNSNNITVYDTFYNLDNRNFNLAINSIKLRFGKF